MGRETRQAGRQKGRQTKRKEGGRTDRQKGGKESRQTDRNAETIKCLEIWRGRGFIIKIGGQFGKQQHGQLQACFVEAPTVSNIARRGCKGRKGMRQTKATASWTDESLVTSIWTGCNFLSPTFRFLSRHFSRSFSKLASE